jgi:membrane protein
LEELDGRAQRRDHGGRPSGARRQEGSLRAGGGAWAALGWTLSAVFAIGLWWWTPHLLMLGRISWRALLPTALILGTGSTLLEILTRLLLPTVLDQSVHEYGPMGMVLTFMSWLVAVCGVIVIGAGVGRILGAPEEA